MPLSKSRKKRTKSRKNVSGNPQSIQRRPRVVVKTFEDKVITAPAPSAIRRRVPKAFVQNRLAQHMNVFFGLQASSLASKLSTDANDVLTRCSAAGSASAVLTELMVEGVLPETDQVGWLENQYRGTWARPSSAVSVYFEPDHYASLSSWERRDAYMRLIQCVEVVEHQLSNGTYAVYLLRAVSLIQLFRIMRWVVSAELRHQVGT